MKAPINTKLKKATYLSGYVYRFEFSDGVVSEVNFEPIISYGESLRKFLDVENFKKMKFDKYHYDIYWGKDWDMSFGLDQYYKETEINPKNRK
jgi:hypothetical protein